MESASICQGLAGLDVGAQSREQLSAAEQTTGAAAW